MWCPLTDNTSGINKGFVPTSLISQEGATASSMTRIWLDGETEKLCERISGWELSDLETPTQREERGEEEVEKNEVEGRKEKKKRNRSAGQVEKHNCDRRGNV